VDVYRLRKLRDKLKKYVDYKKDNMLSFMEWEKYEKQNEFRLKILDRIKTGVGPKIFVVFGGNRSGKTELGAGVIAQVLEEQPRYKVLCATVNYSLSVQVQQAKVNKIIRNSNIRYGEYNPVRGYKNDIIEMNNRSTCIFRSYAQGRESVQGMDLDCVWLDEESQWDFFQEILARTADRNGVIIFTFTSLMGFTRLVNFLWESNNPLVLTTTLSILDNPFIDNTAKENWIKTIDKDDIESRIHGKPHLKEGLIYKSFSSNHIIEPFEWRELLRRLPKRYYLHEGIYPHERTPHHWVQFLYDKDLNILYVVDELKAPTESMIVKDFSSLIRHKRRSVIPSYCQIDTSSMKPDIISRHPDEDQENVHTVRMEFMKNGIDTILCSKDNAVGINAVKQRLKVVKTIEGIVKRKPLIYIFNNCSGVIWEFKRYSWGSYSSSTMSEKKELMNKPLKKDDHFMDIIKYECIKLQNDYMYQESEDYKDESIYAGMGY